MRFLSIIFLFMAISLVPADAFALEKNHSHRWNNNSHHKRFKPLDVPADEAQKVYEKSLADLEKSIDANDVQATRSHAAKALSALETTMRSSNDRDFVETRREKERTLDSIRHSAGKKDMRKARQQFDSLHPSKN